MTRLAALAVLALCGCEQRTGDDAGLIAFTNTTAQRTVDLEARVIALERENKYQAEMIRLLGESADASARVDNDNVGIYNDFKDATNAGIDRIEARLGM